MAVFKSLRGISGSAALALGTLGALSGAAPAAAADTDYAEEGTIPDVTYPAIAERGAAAKDFVPQGWTIETEQKGDLNKDGRPDLALVVRMNDPANVLVNSGMGDSPFNTNPRILVVGFGQTDGSYRRVVANHAFIPRRDNPVQADFYSGLSIKQGLLRVDFENFMSAGGWGAWTATYAFRWQGKNFVLVGYDRSEVQRNSGETLDFSVNYLTGKRKTAKGSIESEKPGKAVWTKEKRHVPITLDAIPDGMGWHPDYPDGYPDK